MTIQGLSSNNYKLAVSWNFGAGLDLGINGVWYQNPSQMSSYGAYVKNGDQLQFRYTIPSKGTKVVSLSVAIPGVDRVTNPQLSDKVVKQWEIYPR